MYALASLLVVVAISLLITRVAVVILVATGLSGEEAAFQARSAFTGAGFTTTESEQILAHRLRRKVTMFLMLLGNAGIVAASGTLIIGFRGSSAHGPAWARIAELILGLFLLLYLSKSRWVDRWLTSAARRALRGRLDVDIHDVDELIALPDGHAVVELSVRGGDELADRRLDELARRGDGTMVLGISRAGGAYESAPGGAAVAQAGDTLVVYGPAAALVGGDGRAAAPAPAASSGG